MKYKIINRKKRIAVRTVDILFHPLVFGLNLLRGQKKMRLHPRDFPNIRKILLIRTAYTGDVVMTLPVLNPLRAAFPQAEITFLTSQAVAPVLENQPAINRVIHYDAFWFYAQPRRKALKKYQLLMKRLRQEQFDVVIDSRGDIRDIFLLVYRSHATHRISYGIGGGVYWLTQVIPFREIKHRVEFHLDILRELNIPVSDKDILPQIKLTESEKQNAKYRLLQMQLNPAENILLAIHPGARMPLKQWLLPRFAKLMATIAQANLGKVIVFTTPKERDIVDRAISQSDTHHQHNYQIISDLTLRDLAAMLSFCRVLVCNDSAPMHIAAAVGTKTVAIFGPSKSVETGPVGDAHTVIEKPFLCRTTCDEATCHYRIYQDCMQSIPVEEVYQAVKKTVESSQ